MTDDTAHTLNRLGYAADREIDKLTAPLADTVAAAVRKHAVTDHTGKPVVTLVGYRLIMVAVDDALSRIYGHGPNTTAPMHQVIAGAARDAHRTAVEATAREIRGRLKGEPGLLRALEGAS